MKKFLLTLWRCLYPVGIYYSVQMFLQLLFYMLLAMVGREEIYESALRSNSLALTAVAAAVTIPAFLLLMTEDRRRENAKKDRSFSVSPLFYLVVAAGTAGICFLAEVFISAAGIPDYDPAFQEVSTILSAPSVAVQILSACFFAPLAEELLFRGLVFRRIRASYGPAAAIIFSALAFGVFHGNLTQGIYAGILGLFLAWAYQKTDAFLLPVLMHAFSNFSSVLLSETDAGMKLESTAAGSLFLLAVSAVLGFMAVKLIRKYKSADSRTDNGKETTYEDSHRNGTML